MSNNSTTKLEKIVAEINQRLPIEISPNVMFKSTAEINEKYEIQVALIVSKKFSTDHYTGINCDILIVDKTTRIILTNKSTTFLVKHSTFKGGFQNSKYSVKLSDYDTREILEKSQKLIEQTALDMLLK
jgi:hypothetical protein